jgi:purine-binding chemotaxis protein CheW
MSLAAESRVGEAFSFLTFVVGGSSYALPIGEIWEILEYRKVSAVPGSSPMVHGVFNYSGMIVPVVDLCAKFGDGLVEVTKNSCIVVVNARGGEESLRVGLLVDAVRDVLDVGPDAIEPAPAFGSRVKLEYLDGLLRTKDGLTIVLAADRFLSASELMEVSAVVSEENKKSSKKGS